MALRGAWTRVEDDRLAVSGHGNDILAALPASERVALGPRLERRRAEVGDELFRPMERIRHVYFPVSCVVSLLTGLRDGRGIETATIGREGVVGVFLVLGDDRDPNARAVVQMDGELLRLPADVFRAAASGDSKLGTLMLGYTRALLVHVSQTAACGTAHRVPQRLARWLLQTSDRTGKTEIRLTHDFLSHVLGVRRASITAAVRELAADGSVRARRGAIVVDDRAALERAACECYTVVRDAYSRLMP